MDPVIDLGKRSLGSSLYRVKSLKPEEIIVLAAGSYKEGTKAFLLS